MRTTTFLVLAFLVFPLLATAGPAETMRKAAGLYQQGERERAMRMWEELRNGGFVSPALFFNLGNGYFETGQLGKAILNYERALLLQPAQARVRHNLDLARRKVAGNPLPWPEFSLVVNWRALRGALPSDIWALLGLLACWGGWVAWGLGRRRTKRWPWMMAWVAGLFLALLTWLLAWSSTRALESDFSVVVVTSVPVQVGPDPESGVLETAYEGWKVLRLDRIGDWIKVELPDGQEGWVQPEGLESL